MTESMQKFKEMVERAETVALRHGKANGTRKILTSLLLHRALLKFGKKSDSDNVFDERTKNCALALFDGNENIFNKNFNGKENILIKLNTKELPVSALRYENEGDILKIVLESNGANGAEPLNLKSISVEKERAPADLLILVDPAESEIEELIKINPHKDVVKLTAKDAGLAVKAAEILETFFGEMPDEFKEALWFLVEEENKTGREPRKERLALLTKLLERKIDFEKIKNAKETLRPPAFWKFLGRALARSDFEKNISTTWTFLPKSDFEKTGEDEGALLGLLGEIKNIRPESDFIAILWENSSPQPNRVGAKSVSAVISSGDAAKLNALAEMMAASPASHYFFVNGFAAFSEAEMKIRSFIRRVL